MLNLESDYVVTICRLPGSDWNLWPCGSVPVGLGREFSLDMNAVLLGRSVRGMFEGDSVPQAFLPRPVSLYRQGRFPFDKLITTYPFSPVNQAVADVESGKVIKPVLLM